MLITAERDGYFGLRAKLALGLPIPQEPLMLFDTHTNLM